MYRYNHLLFMLPLNAGVCTYLPTGKLASTYAQPTPTSVPALRTFPRAMPSSHIVCGSTIQLVWSPSTFSSRKRTLLGHQINKNLTEKYFLLRQRLSTPDRQCQDICTDVSCCVKQMRFSVTRKLLKVQIRSNVTNIRRLSTWFEASGRVHCIESWLFINNI